MHEKAKPSKTGLSCLFPFRVLRVLRGSSEGTTKDSKYTKRRNHQRQGFLVLPFRVLRVFRGSSKGNHERLEIHERRNQQRQDFLVLPFILISILRCSFLCNSCISSLHLDEMLYCVDVLRALCRC